MSETPSEPTASPSRTASAPINTVSVQPGTPQAGPAEHVLYERPGVRITNKQANIAGTTIPLEAITAITLAEAPRAFPPAALLLLGTGAVLALGSGYFGSGWGLVAGLLFLVVGLIRIYRERAHFHLLLDRSDGKGDAFISTERVRMERLMKALHKALLQQRA